MRERRGYAVALLRGGLLYGIVAVWVGGFSAPLWGQPGWRWEDIVTYSDGRDARCVEVTPREVIVATGEGLWRWDRFTMTPLDPWVMGIGWERAIDLRGGRVLLWHPETQTLWLATRNQLLYFRTDVERWKLLETSGALITSLGDAGREIWVERDKRIEVIDGFTLQNLGSPTDSAQREVRWQGRRGWKPHSYPPYREKELRLRFFPRDGRVEDEDWSVFQPIYDLADDEFQRSYICYPGLGLGVGDEKTMRIEFFQLGPSGGDVKAIALEEDGRVWLGGNNPDPREGITLWERQTGSWKRFGWRITPGMKDQSVNDIAVDGGRVYFATRGGLVIYDQTSNQFRTRDRFAGLAGDYLWSVRTFGGWLLVGSDQGVNRVRFSPEVVLRAGDKILDQMRSVQIAVDRDSAWVAGGEGVFKTGVNFQWERVSGEKIIGDEPTRALCATPKTLYLGGRGGVRMWDRERGVWSSIPSRPYLSGLGVLSLMADPADSLLWIGTDGGLFRYSRQWGYWRHYTTDQGLPHLRIQTLRLEADTLWIGTPKGLTRFLWNRPERDF